MAVPSNTIQAVGRVGVREDLSDKIHELFPDDCPFQKAIGRESASQVLHEWQTDSLAAASATNASIQGDDLTNSVRANTVRQGNYSQIMTKVVGASTTLEASSKAGRKSELAREIMKSGREIKTDAEMRFSGNYAAVAPAAGVAGMAAGALAYLRTNVARGTGGATTYSGTGVPTTAATNGTAAAPTEATFKTLLASIWTAGGNPKLAIMSMAQKAKFGAFAGLASSRREVGDSRLTIVAGADIYVSDAGETQFVPSRFCSTRDILVIDPEYWAIAELDGMKVTDLARTGLATRKALHQEVTLVCKNEAANGVYADVL